jgi:hypothetical protein
VVLPQNGDAAIRPRPILSGNFSVHYSQTILPFYIWCVTDSVVIERVNKEINIFPVFSLFQLTNLLQAFPQ